jgi:pilus assembly protein CpaC
VRSIAAALLLIPAFSQAETIRLAPGRQQVIEAPGIVRAAIGDAQVADVKVLARARQAVVIARKPGTTDLILWLRDRPKRTYAIVVTGTGRDVDAELTRLLAGIEGIAVRGVGGTTVVDGQIYRGSDLERIRKVLGLYPGVADLTRPNRAALAVIAREAERALAEAGIASVRVRAVGNEMVLTGSAGPGGRERARRVVTSFFPDVVDQLSEGVDPEPQVLVDVKLAEVKSDSMGTIGVRWPASLSATGSAAYAGQGWSGSLTVGKEASVTLHGLLASGAARLLSNPKLLCRNGVPASFLAGGEIPIRLIGERTASVQFKPYGVSLEVTARADSGGNVRLDLAAKISDLDTATAVEGIPGILEHSVRTAAGLRYGDTVVLGGLIDRRARKNVTKVPLLGHLPVLGELFKSRDFQRSRSDFLVFLTPLPADSSGGAAGLELRQMGERTRQAEREAALSLLD